MPAPSWLSRLPLLAALAVVPACKAKTQPVTPDDAALDAAGEAAVAAAPVTAVARPAQMLPSGTPLVVVGKSPARTAEIFERDRLVERFGARYQMLQTLFGAQIGFDPLDPAGYAGVGIDPDEPFGVAVLDATHPTLAVFATVGDLGKLKAAARDVAGRQRVELQERDLGTAVVLRAPQDPRAPALVLRGTLAMLVIPMGGEPSPTDYAERLATIEAADSLSRARGYRRAMGAYSEGDVLAFVDPAGLVGQVTAAMAAREVEAPTADWATQELEAAKERGAPPEEIARLTKTAEDNGASDAQWRGRDQARQDLLALTVSGMEGLGVRLSGKTSGVFIEGRAALSGDAFVSRALKNVGGRALLPTAMSGEPLLLVTGGTEPDAVQEWVDLALQAEGSSWAQLSAELKEQIGLDLDKDLMPLLVGDAGFAISLDEPLDPSKLGDLEQSLGFAAHARVTDPAAAKALLRKIDASTGEVGTMLTADGDRYVADIPKWRKVWVEIAGDHLVVTTDAQLGIRVARGTRGMMGRATTPPEAWAAMMMPDRAAVFAQDLRLIAMTFATSRSFAPGMVDTGDLADVPLSRKAKAKQAEIAAVDAEIEAAEKKGAAAQLGKVDAIAAPLGTTVVTAAFDDRGLDIVGAQLIRGESLGAVLENVLALATEPDKADSDAVSRLFERRAKLENELREIREADAARLKGRKPRGAKKKPAK